MQKKEIINAIKILIVLLPGILICIFNLDQYPAYFWDESYYFHQAGLILSGNASDAFYSLAYPNLDVYLFALFRILAPTIYTSFYFMRYGSGLFAILTGLLIYKVVKLYAPRAWAIFAAYLYYFSNLTLIFNRMAMLDPSLSFFSILTLYLILIYQKSYNEKVEAINANPDSSIQIKEVLHKLNAKYLILISLSSVCVIFSKITGLYLLLFYPLIILFQPLCRINTGGPDNVSINSKRQNPIRKICEFIMNRIKRNTVIFCCLLITGISIFLYIVARFLYFHLNAEGWYNSIFWEFFRFDFDATRSFIMNMFILDPALCIGIIAVIYYSFKRQHNILIIMNFSIIIVMYFSVTAFNYHYIVDIIPFLIIMAVLLLHEKNVFIIFFIIFNLFTINGYVLDGFFTAFPDYQDNGLYFLALIIAMIYIIAIQPEISKKPTTHRQKFFSRIPKFFKENQLFWIFALIILPSGIGAYVYVGKATENAGNYAMLSEINAHTNESDYVFTSHMFPFADYLKAQQLNILYTYDNTTNAYNITILKYVILDQFWVWYSDTAQNITQLRVAVRQIQKNWTRLIAYRVRWTNSELSPFATSIPLIPEIDPGNVVLYRNPSIIN